jgi:hypothetical protein
MIVAHNDYVAMAGGDLRGLKHPHREAPPPNSRGVEVCEHTTASSFSYLYTLIMTLQRWRAAGGSSQHGLQLQPPERHAAPAFQRPGQQPSGTS